MKHALSWYYRRMGCREEDELAGVDPVVERLARFLRKNYVAGTTDVPWRQADGGERLAWLCEAEIIAGMVRGTE